MPVTCCVLPFDRVLRRLPVDRERWRSALNEVPRECPNQGCSPGGCRKHCAAYAAGAWVRANAPKPRKGER